MPGDGKGFSEMKRLREMYERGEITIEELFERVRVGRFDNIRKEVNKNVRSL